MKKIFFATTNEGKLKEAREILAVEVEGCGLEIDEIQSLNPEEVAVKKAREYYKKLKKPIVVEDVSLIFNALNSLPGPYINDFLKSIGNSGLIKLLNGQKDRSAVAITTLVYFDKSGEHVFKGEVKCQVSQKEKGENGFGFDTILIPEGQPKTFAEMDMKEKNKYSMRAKAFKKLKTYLDSLA